MIFETLRQHDDPFGQMNITGEAISRANEAVVQEEIIDYYASARWTHKGVLEIADDDPEAIETAKDFEAALLNYPVLSVQVWSEIEYDLIKDRIEFDFAVADVIRDGGGSWDLAEAIDGGEIDPDCPYSGPIVEALYMHRLDVPRAEAKDLVADLRSSIRAEYGSERSAATGWYIAQGHDQAEAQRLADLVCDDPEAEDHILAHFVLGEDLALP